MAEGPVNGHYHHPHPARECFEKGGTELRFLRAIGPEIYGCSMITIAPEAMVTESCQRCDIP